MSSVGKRVFLRFIEVAAAKKAPKVVQVSAKDEDWLCEKNQAAIARKRAELLAKSTASEKREASSSRVAPRVLHRWLAKTAYDFPTNESLQQYLREHPKADRGKHKVVENMPGYAQQAPAPQAAPAPKAPSKEPERVTEEPVTEDKDAPARRKKHKRRPEKKLSVSDADVDAALVKHKVRFTKLVTALDAKVKQYSEKPTHLGKKDFESLSRAEKLLFVGGHDIGKYFQESVLKGDSAEEHYAIMSHWRAGGSGVFKAQRLHGYLSEAGFSGHPPPGDADKQDARTARREGAKSKEMDAYVKESVAFTRAFFKHLGVTEITVYRDVNNQLDDTKDGDDVQLNCREASSFTFDPGQVGVFGTHTIKLKLPIDRIFGSPITNPKLGSAVTKKDSGGDFGESGEAEIIVMGASDLVGQKIR